MRVLAGVAVALCAVMGLGCGDLNTSPRGMRVVPAERLSDGELERFPAGSPQRAALEWFRALQDGDFRSAARYYLRADVGELRRLRRGARGTFAAYRVRKIVDVTRTGPKATVFMLLSARRATPNGRSIHYDRPQAVTLTRTAGGWKLTDNYFLRAASTSRVKIPSASPYAKARVITPGTLTRADVDSDPRGSPRHTIRSLVRALQFYDPSAVLASIAPRWRLPLADVEKYLPLMAPVASSQGHTALKEVRRTKERAVLVARLPANTISFRLARVGEVWKLAGAHITGVADIGVR